MSTPATPQFPTNEKIYVLDRQHSKIKSIWYATSIDDLLTKVINANWIDSNLKKYWINCILTGKFEIR